MFLLSDVLTYIRRIIKSPTDADITDNLLIDYVNRFWISDVDARMQLFDLKTTYRFQTTPGVDQYNMPLYSVQTEPGNQTIGMYPVYQGFTGPCLVNGIGVAFSTEKSSFYNVYPNVIQQYNIIAVGDGTAGPYTLNFPFLSAQSQPQNPPYNCILRGHVDIAGIMSTGVNIDPPVNATFSTTIPVTSTFPAVYITSIDSTGANVVVADSGQFLTADVNYGLLMQPGPAPFGNTSLGAYSTTSNTVNYLTGVATVTFPVNIPDGNNINLQCGFFETGLPRSVLYYNNVITLRAPPAMQYLVELEAYLSPAAFLNTSSALPFGYMAEYIARGAARKILSDTGDQEQFMFYEPLFREQEMLVWKRSQRQLTSTRSQTIFSQGSGNSGVGIGMNGGSTA